MVIIKEDIQFVSFNPLIKQAKKKKNCFRVHTPSGVLPRFPV